MVPFDLCAANDDTVLLTDGLLNSRRDPGRRKIDFDRTRSEPQPQSEAAGKGDGESSADTDHDSARQRPTQLTPDPPPQVQGLAFEIPAARIFAMGLEGILKVTPAMHA